MAVEEVEAYRKQERQEEKKEKGETLESFAICNQSMRPNEGRPGMEADTR